MEEQNDYNPEDEVVTGNWNTPKVSLKEVEVKTGEEDETLFWSGRSKLYRWVNGEWKERGLGESKLLKHKEKGTIRFLLRQEKTFKIVANHYIYPTESYCKLVPNAGSEKIYAWTVKDFAEEPKIEQFALKFNTPEAAKVFKEKFEEAGENNRKLMNVVNEKAEEHEKPKDEVKKEDNKEEKKEEPEKEPEKKPKKDKEEKVNPKKDEEKTNAVNEQKKETGGGGPAEKDSKVSKKEEEDKSVKGAVKTQDKNETEENKKEKEEHKDHVKEEVKEDAKEEKVGEESKKEEHIETEKEKAKEYKKEDSLKREDV